MRAACRSDVRFAFGISLIWLTLYNFTFWRQTLEAMWSPSPGAAAFLISVFLLAWCLQALLLLAMPTRFLMRVAASGLFVVASLSSYFTQAYGVVMNRDMLRNALQTDAAEVAGLINVDLLWHVSAFGVLPAVLVWMVELPPVSVKQLIRQRLGVTAGALLLCAGATIANSANYAVYFRAHKPIRFTLAPAAPVVSATSLLTQLRHADDLPLKDPGGVANRVERPQAKPLVLFIVVGETARAANFQLGGYTRATTPELASRHDIAYFKNATSCGTATAISVPCMFSHLGREHFDVDESAGYTNVLDSLVDAGFDVEWRDNNAGCKGVCARIKTINYSSRDDVMLEDLSARLQRLSRDTVIVFHQIGSHGPAYAQRYPPQFERFKPACPTNELQHCSPQEIVNAYDNTIAYTDHVLARQIELLQAAADRVDSMLIYVSDHGESLGEQGIYLHGMPYPFAPRVQTEVPFLLWASDGYARRTQLSVACLQAHVDEPVSHDVLYHTILGAAETRDRVYDPRLDLLAPCRRGALLSSSSTWAFAHERNRPAPMTQTSSYLRSSGE